MAVAMVLKRLKKAKALINQKRDARIAAAKYEEVYKAQRGKNKVHFMRQKMLWLILLLWKAWKTLPL